MIDFQNASFFKLSETNSPDLQARITELLIEQENIISIFKGIRDFVAFTNKRVIAVNVQGITGKKVDFTSLPYSKITAYSVETAGHFDLDAELDLWFSGLGKVRFEFKGHVDIKHINKIISSYAL